jgi:hypothetical protein
MKYDKTNGTEARTSSGTANHPGKHPDDRADELGTVSDSVGSR